MLGAVSGIVLGAVLGAVSGIVLRAVLGTVSGAIMKRVGCRFMTSFELCAISGKRPTN
uniref:hypothetical protein n=1 Tax=Thalassoglobus neptunius TaxID=1938619 RepID=UPI0036F1D7A0